MADLFEFRQYNFCDYSAVECSAESWCKAYIRNIKGYSVGCAGYSIFTKPTLPRHNIFECVCPRVDFVEYYT